MIREEREAAIAYINGYRKLDEDLHNTAPKDSISYYATDKCLKYWDMAIQALEKANIYDDGEHYVTISKALYDRLNVDTCTDAVSRGVFEQVTRERDIAIEQLHELGYELGQKIEPLEVEAAKLQQAYDKGFEDCRQAVLKIQGKYAEYIGATKFWQMSDDIKALSPVMQKNIECDDAISRQAVRHILNHEVKMPIKIWKKLFELVDCLPPVTPQQKYGKWIEHPEIETSAPEYLMFYECSECGNKPCFCKSDIHKKRFCSNCGCRMVEPQERSE